MYQEPGHDGDAATNEEEALPWSLENVHGPIFRSYGHCIRGGDGVYT